MAITVFIVPRRTILHTDERYFAPPNVTAGPTLPPLDKASQSEILAGTASRGGAAACGTGAGELVLAAAAHCVAET
jgi:hypothetical protein